MEAVHALFLAQPGASRSDQRSAPRSHALQPGSPDCGSLPADLPASGSLAEAAASRSLLQRPTSIGVKGGGSTPASPPVASKPPATSPAPATPPAPANATAPINETASGAGASLALKVNITVEYGQDGGTGSPAPTATSPAPPPPASPAPPSAAAPTTSTVRLVYDGDREKRINVTRAPGAAQAVYSYTSVGTSSDTATCAFWGDLLRGWTAAPTPTKYGAKGAREVDIGTASDYIKLICDDSSTAGGTLAQAVQSGGQTAEGWTDAVFFGTCTYAVNANEATWQAAMEAIKSDDPAKLESTKAWFANLAKAADAVDIPLCTTVALVDAAGSAAEQSSFHTTG